MDISKILKKRMEKKEEKVRKAIYNVVGVSFEGRQDILKKYLEQYKKSGKRRECQLFLDNQNKYDSNAIKVYICGDEFESIGFISKEENKQLRSKFDKINRIKINSIGKTETGIIGVSIRVEFQD